MKKIISRRTFAKLSVAGSSVLMVSPAAAFSKFNADVFSIRLGGTVFEKYNDPDE